jgi:outer membrane protein
MSSRWKLPALITLLATVFLCSAAGAEEPVKIGFVDMQKALNTSSSGKSAVEKLKGLMEAKTAELQNEKVAIDKMKDDLDKQGLLMNETARRDREAELRRLERDLSRKFNDSKEEVSQEQERLMEVIRKDLFKVTEELGREKGFTIVLERQYSGIIYATDSVDLTEEIIKRYDSWKSQ